MITAVDTSVIIDILIADPVHGRRSATALGRAQERGRLVACSVVWAEVMAWYGSADRMSNVTGELGLSYEPISQTAATAAGMAWHRYRRDGGPRTRIIADFLIGAHAITDADALLTRDRGFFRRYFADLRIIDPSAG